MKQPSPISPPHVITQEDAAFRLGWPDLITPLQQSLVLIIQMRMYGTPNLLVADNPSLFTGEPLVFFHLADKKLHAVSTIINTPGFNPNTLSSYQPNLSILHALVTAYYYGNPTQDEKEALGVMVRTVLTLNPALSTDSEGRTAVDIARAAQPLSQPPERHFFWHKKTAPAIPPEPDRLLGHLVAYEVEWKKRLSTPVLPTPSPVAPVSQGSAAAASPKVDTTVQASSEDRFDVEDPEISETFNHPPLPKFSDKNPFRPGNTPSSDNSTPRNALSRASLSPAVCATSSSRPPSRAS
jgi:hypothetical protein